MAVRADPGLRGVRFGEQIEVTAWYVLAEALVERGQARRGQRGRGVAEPAGRRLGLVIRDDGCGSDLDRPRGLGLSRLSDRLDTVGGWVIITSGTGLGTSVRVSIPLE